MDDLIGRQVAKLERAFREICGRLDFNMRTGRYSLGLVGELMQHLVGRGYNVQAICDEIGKLEGSNLRPSATKPATAFERPPLVGYWHKHHHQTSFVAANLKNEMMRDGVVEIACAPHYGRPLGDVIGQILHELVVEAFFRKAAEGRLTGEFIVYERLADGSNYYLTLGSHGEYEEVRKRVDAYRTFDEQKGHGKPA